MEVCGDWLAGASNSVAPAAVRGYTCLIPEAKAHLRCVR